MRLGRTLRVFAAGPSPGRGPPLFALPVRLAMAVGAIAAEPAFLCLWVDIESLCRRHNATDIGDLLRSEVCLPAGEPQAAMLSCCRPEPMASCDELVATGHQQAHPAKAAPDASAGRWGNPFSRPLRPVLSITACMKGILIRSRLSFPFNLYPGGGWSCGAFTRGGSLSLE